MTKARNSFEDPMRPRLFTVKTRGEETANTLTFSLVPKSGLPFCFLPGQFNMLYLFGRGEVPVSVSGDPIDTTHIVHTVRDAGSVTHGFMALSPGDTIGIRGPFGKGWPMEELKGRDILFLAGGLGLAPLRPAILYALAHREDYGDLTVLYGSRNPDNLLFVDDFKLWTSAANIRCEITVDHAEAGWHRRVGVITQLVGDASINPLRTTALICGPDIMMRFCIEALKSRGLSDADMLVSLERNMKCAIGHCGHCQLGSAFICRDGPVFRYDRIARFLRVTGL